jgi:hypothetical protein
VELGRDGVWQCVLFWCLHVACFTACCPRDPAAAFFPDLKSAHEACVHISSRCTADAAVACVCVCARVQGPSDTLGLGGEGGAGASDAAGASYLDAFAAFRDEVSTQHCCCCYFSWRGEAIGRLAKASVPVPVVAVTHVLFSRAGAGCGETRTGCCA